MAHHIFQIFYDDRSRSALDPLLIPLDNSESKHPEWFEFWPIRNYLRSHDLDEDSWYGFLSPKFAQKFGIGADQLLPVLDASVDHEDVMLMSPFWDQVAYFSSAFEQGEFWTPGLLASSQMFVDELGLQIDLGRLVATSKTTVFSNYLVAKAPFWRRWLELADALVTCSDQGQGALTRALNQPASYLSRGTPVPMKTFVQERLACLLLEQLGGRVGVIDLSDATFDAALFTPDPASRRRLQACDLMKQQYRDTGEPDYLRVYAKLRRSIATIRPVPFPAFLPA